MARTELEFFPASGGTSILFTTGPTAPYRLITAEGIGPMSVEMQSIKSPGQSGETAVDVILPARIINVQAIIQAVDSSTLWNLRSKLSRALSTQPVRLGGVQVYGLLQIRIDGREPLQIQVVPRSAALPRPAGQGRLAIADIEFFADYPYWQEVSDALLYFTTTGGGFSFGGSAVQFPLTMTSNNVHQDVINLGDVDAPLVMRVYGEATTVRMKNLTTGETIEVGYHILAGDYVEITTAFGAKSITLWHAGVGTNLMGSLNLALPTFWALRPGLNSVKFEADSNISGHAEIYWRQRFSGI